MGHRPLVIREERKHMPGATELPQLVTEFVDMSKEYLRQETVEPAKRLGRFAGFTIGASFLFALGGLMLAIAGMRGIIYLLPDGPNWSALGYVLAALAIGLVIGVMVGVAGRDTESKEV
jgi:Putative Actinobacterial Holin-X, holin superfamily III